jgi:NO-binding membrane sensor protein with MHYT domain
MTMSRKVLCVVYAVIAIAALVATWSHNLVHITGGGSFLNFWEDTKVNAASRSITVDIVLLTVALAILMVIEARKHNVKYVWAYILAGFLIAISVAFPLFLLARELRLEQSDATRLRTSDTILLAIIAIGAAAFTIWLDAV